MIHSSSSSHLQLIGISQKVWHKILYALGRSVAVEQLAKRKKTGLPVQQKKTGKKRADTLV